MSDPVDQGARQRALDTRQSFIVQAPAGSGKTELLVRRYLALLAQVDDPGQVLAITFTKKATAEMRVRIIQALRQVTEKGVPEDNPVLLALAKAARANDAKHNWRLSENTRRLRIQTIDSFCNELVRLMPWSARFGAPPEIDGDATERYLEAAKRTLEHIEHTSKWRKPCRQLLDLVDADWDKAQNLLADMLKKRDKWMRILGTNNIDCEHIEQMWQQHIDEELQKAATQIPKEKQIELAELGAFAAFTLRKSSNTSTIVLDGISKFPAANHQYVDQWKAFTELLLTAKGTARNARGITKRQGFPPKTVEKERMSTLLEWLVEQPAIIETLCIIRMLPPAQFTEAQRYSLDALIQLLPLAAAELRLLFKEQNQADYIELTQRAEMALSQLDNQDNPSDLVLAFDCQLTHLLMDEFQDTSTAHIDLLAKLIAGWQSGDGRTLFFVGDPMQSIYRFREAEVGNFLQVWQDQQFGDISIEPLALKANFRSADVLVTWFNDTFQKVLPVTNDMTKSAVCYSPAYPHVGDRQNSSFHFHLNSNQTLEQQADDIATLIAQAQRQTLDESIAVLGRTRTHLNEIATALRRHAISFQAIDLEKLSDRPAIRDLITITRVLVQPADRIAWLSLVRAPWCGMRLNDIAVLAGSDYSRTLTEVIKGEVALSEHGKAALEKLRDVLTVPLAQRGRIPIRQNVEAAWLMLGGAATVESTDLDNCHRYLDLLDQMEEDRVEINADTLKKCAENLWAQGGDAQVQLLTIHKAKGLEFDTVFLPGLGRGTYRGDKTLLRWCNLLRQLLIAPLPASGNSDDAFYQYLKQVDEIHERNEAGRLLYVACTRARKNLHLFGNVQIKDSEPKEPNKKSLLSLLWPVVAERYEAITDVETADVADENEIGAEPPQTLQRLPLSWTPPILPDGIPVASRKADAIDPIEFSWAGETARIVGIVIHRILQHVDEIGWQRLTVDTRQKALWRNQLVENGIASAYLETAVEQVANAIDNMRQDPRAEWIFSNAHCQIKTEWPLAGLVDGKVKHVVIDRSFIDQEDVFWIIDFKSSHHQGADVEEFLASEEQRYSRQMVKYAEIIRQLQPLKIRLGLYFPVLRGWREWEA